MSFVSAAPVALLLAAALWLSRPAAPARRARVIALVAVLAALGVTVVLLPGGRAAATGAFGSDPLGAFSSAILLAVLALALVVSRPQAGPFARLPCGGALAVVAVSSLDLLVVAVAIHLYGLVFWEGGRRNLVVSSLLSLTSFASVGFIAWKIGGTDLAGIAASGIHGPLRLAIVLFVVSLAFTWLAQSRRAVRFGSAHVLGGIASSLVLLVIVATAFLRLQAWLPKEAIAGAVGALALLGLGLGSLGMLLATRISTFATALLLERAGAVAFALLGGVRGRVPLLVELVATAAALLLVALALEDRDGKTPLAVDDLANLSSSSRALLFIGTFMASALPPFPGFFARLASANAVLLSGSAPTVAAMVLFMVLAGVGSMRLVARGWESSSESSSVLRPLNVVVGLGLAAAATWFLLISPGPLLEWATRAAAGIF